MCARSWIVGSGPDCDIRVEAPTVSGRHCRLTEQGDVYLIEDLGSSNGTYVQGQRITTATSIQRSETVTLGQSIALPWPASAVSITIGRAPENDLVIDFDAVSGCHARLEREGNQLYLVDVGSTNGTAVNDPTNKITRSLLAPTDQVFFGTHHVNAADLISCLPKETPRATTVIESSPLQPSIFRNAAPLDLSGLDQSEHRSSSLPESFHSAKSWFVGIALSVLCLCLVFGGNKLLWSDFRAEEAVPKVASPAIANFDEGSSGLSPSSPASSKGEGPATVNMPDETTIREAEPAIGLLGLRVGGQLPYLTDVTAWSCGQNRVICPTEMLEALKAVPVDPSIRDVTLAIYTRKRGIAILDYVVGEGVATGFSVVRLEAQLDTDCIVASTESTSVKPGQHLAMIVARTTTTDDPESIEFEFVRLILDRIERDVNGAAEYLHCRPEAATSNVGGSPVFDAAGHVIGCAVSANRQVVVIPIEHLTSLVTNNPQLHRGTQ